MKRALFLALISCACSAQTLLFKSGYQSATSLSTISGGATGPNSVTQNFSGTDSSTGFAWPMNLGWSSTLTYDGLHVEPPGGDTSPLVNHWFNRLETITGHTGASTTALHLEWAGYTQDCCQQTVFQTSNMVPALKKTYYRFWLRYPSYLATWLAGNTGTYIGQTIMSYKTSSDYRIHLNSELNGDNHNLHVKMTVDALGQTGIENYVDPITGAITQSTNATDPREFAHVANTNITITAGTWFLVEVSFNRSVGNDGYYDTAINGQTVGHTFGPSYGALNQEIQDMYWQSLYWFQPPPTPGGGTGAQEEIDDFEVWSSPPCGTFPCGSGSTTTWTGAVPPFVTSPQGAVGVVGVPFQYQTTATNSPTSYSTQESLPSGLSLNGSTGLVSGTPTTAGTTSGVYIVAHNSMGSGSQWTEFQINNPATSPPTISSFTATPSTISAGQWSQLKWVQSGATTLTINGVNVNGQDPYPVNPTTTTTYTLSAQNRAGSAPTRTVTVTVTGTSPTPVITSFIATPSTITPGQSSTLSWITSGQTSLSIDQGVGSVTGLTSKIVTPSVTTTYKLTATNVAGSVDSPPATVTVSVPVAITSFTASPSTPVPAGTAITLSWASTGGTTATLNGASVALSGSQTVTPLVTTSYTLVVSNSAGSKSQTLTVSIGALPVISAFTASPSTIALGGSSTLTLASSGGTTCTIDQGIGTVACNGTTPVSPVSSKVYTVTATNSFGSVTAKTIVGVSISALLGATVVGGQVVIH